MRLKTVPFGSQSEVHWGSDIDTLNFSSAGLILRLARKIEASGVVSGLEVIFKTASALRYLDEPDLSRYWNEDGFARGFHILEVKEGGWSNEEDQLQGYLTARREWLVVTGKGCVSVFASESPEIRSVSWQQDA